MSQTILIFAAILFRQMSGGALLTDFSNDLLLDADLVDDEGENSLPYDLDDIVFNECHRICETMSVHGPTKDQGLGGKKSLCVRTNCPNRLQTLLQYPGHDTGAGTCHFRLVKSKPEICQIRVDFVDTEMLSPVDGNCDDQYMSVSGSIWPTGFKRLCGINPDQHFYIQLDNKATFQHIDITITTIRSNKPYKFGLWITQINCNDGSAVQSPPGCTQFHFGSEGILKTFNFEGVQYLGSQNYKICIRSERGACFVGFAADANHFMLQLHPSESNTRFRNNNRNSARLPAGRGDEDCTTDFILIPGGRGNITRYGVTYDRYCGGQLNVESAKEESAPIYSEITSPVIWLQFVTGPRESHILAELKKLKNNNNNGNNLNDKYEGTGPGFRLRYSQLNNCVHQSFFGN